MLNMIKLQDILNELSINKLGFDNRVLCVKGFTGDEFFNIFPIKTLKVLKTICDNIVTGKQIGRAHV